MQQPLLSGKDLTLEKAATLATAMEIAATLATTMEMAVLEPQEKNP